MNTTLMTMLLKFTDITNNENIEITRIGEDEGYLGEINLICIDNDYIKMIAKTFTIPCM